MNKPIEINCMFGGYCSYENNTVLVWDLYNNGIEYYDLLKNEINPVRLFTNDEIGNFEGLKMYRNRDSIYIAAQRSLQVLKYSLIDGSYTMHTSDDYCSASQMNYDTFSDDDKIVFIPNDISEKTFAFSYNEKKFKEIKWNKNKISSEVSSNIVCDEKYAYFAIGKPSKIIKLNKENYDYETIMLEGTNSLNAIGLDDHNSLWCISDNKFLLKYDGGQMVRSQICEKNVDEAFAKTIYIKDKIICIPRFFREIIIHDVSSGENSCIKFLEEEVKSGSASYFLNYVIMEKMLVLLPWGALRAGRINLSNYTAEFYKVHIDSEIYLRQFRSFFLYERENCTLDYFIDKISLLGGES